MRFTALELANMAALWVSPVPESTVVALRDTQLFVGENADHDVVATIACRRMLQLRGEQCTRQAVRKEVEKYGFRYAEAKSPPLRKARAQANRRRASQRSA